MLHEIQEDVLLVKSEYVTFLARLTFSLQVLIGVDDLGAVEVIGSTTFCGEDPQEQPPRKTVQEGLSVWIFHTFWLDGLAILRQAPLLDVIS